MKKLLPFHQIKVVLKTFRVSVLVLSACVDVLQRGMNMKINHVHKRALRLVYNDYQSSFEVLLKNDKSISVHHRNIHSVAIEMYKVKNNLSPPFMKEIFNYNNGGPVTRR